MSSGSWRPSIWQFFQFCRYDFYTVTQKMATGMGHLNRLWGPGEGNLTAENQKSQMHEKKSMTLHKRSPKMCGPPHLPITLLDTTGHLWSIVYVYLVRTVTAPWQNTEFHVVYVIKTNLKCCAGDSFNKYYVRIFVKKRTSVNFNFERKRCGVDQMFSRDVANRLSCPNWERFVRNWQWTRACNKPWSEGRLTWSIRKLGGSGGMLPREILKFGPLEWLKMH